MKWTSPQNFRVGRGLVFAMICQLFLSPGSSMAEPVVGQVLLYAGRVCPAGWLTADGSELSITDYPELYAAIADTHCPRDAQGVPGCAAGSFALPNLTQRFPRGASSSNDTGDLGGGALSAANLPPHTHSLDGVRLSGRLGVSTESGDRASPTSNTMLADSNRTAIYKVSSEAGAYLDDVEVMGGDTDVTKTNETSTESAEAGILPPFTNMQYCVASGGDTAPLVEVGLKFVEADNPPPTTAKLEPIRIDVSGVEPGGSDDCFVDSQSRVTGTLCLDKLESANKTITRPNIRFTLIGDNLCSAYRTYTPFDNGEGVYGDQYNAELTLTGVQVAIAAEDEEKDRIVWGNAQFAQSVDPDFVYTLQQDEYGRGGFIAVDTIDERTLVMETRNVSNTSYRYRIQAKCGDGDVPPHGTDGYPKYSTTETVLPGAYYVYFDPSIRQDGRGGGGSNY